MTSLGFALAYVRRGLPVFPCQSHGHSWKRPLIERGFHAATRDREVIIDHWGRWPDALIGIPTGLAAGFVVLDIDIKDSRANGFDSLEELGVGKLPDTPMVHTPSGGLHLYFAPPEATVIRNTAGERGRGIGSGLDWRGEGGYVIVPSPGSGYRWDCYWNLHSVALAPVPSLLLPREPLRETTSCPMRPIEGLSPYGEAALDSACRRIKTAPAGEQEITLHGECFAIGALAGVGVIPHAFARRVLIWAAQQMPDYDPRRPWRASEIKRKVERSFEKGLEHPRGLRRA